MKKIIAFVLTLTLIAALTLAATIYPAVSASAASAEMLDAPVVFYDEAVDAVEGVAPESTFLWMLPEGVYTVTYTDGSTAVVTVENGSWCVTDYMEA